MTEQKIFHLLQAVDSFVYPSNKLKGVRGNGERRLYISSNNTIQDKLVQKDWKISFSDEYLENCKEFMNNQDEFDRIDNNRFNNMKSNIETVNNTFLKVRKQDGQTDVRRKYIGPIKFDKLNLERWDTLRKCIAPTRTTIMFYDNGDHFEMKICHNKNENVKKYNKAPAGTSYISNECLSLMEDVLDIEIQSGINGGEFKKKQSNGYFTPADGYHNCKDHKCSGDENNPCIHNNTIWEFQGTYWHDDKFFPGKAKKDKNKKILYESKGYKVIQIHEKKYCNMKKLMKNAMYDNDKAHKIAKNFFITLNELPHENNSPLYMNKTIEI